MTTNEPSHEDRPEGRDMMLGHIESSRRLAVRGGATPRGPLRIYSTSLSLLPESAPCVSRMAMVSSGAC